MSFNWNEFIAAVGKKITWDELITQQESIVGRDVMFRGAFGGLWRGPIKEIVLGEEWWRFVFEWVAEFDQKKGEWLLIIREMPFGITGLKSHVEFADMDGLIRLKFLYEKPRLTYIQKKDKVIAIYYNIGNVDEANGGNFAAVLPRSEALERPTKEVKIQRSSRQPPRRGFR